MQRWGILALLAALALTGGCTEPLPPGSIAVASDPAGADVYLDGLLRGETPLLLEGVAAGEHALELRHGGFGAWSDTVSVLPLVHLPVQANLSPIVVNRPPDPGPSDPSATPAPPDGGSRHTRTYRWEYGGRESTFTLSLPQAVYDYYRSRPHDRERDYAQYALSEYDRPYLQGIVQKFRESGEDRSEREVVEHLISFVQSLPYTSDNLTTGYDEYPRYPLETLVDNGGDCEDTAILAAALLNEMGYGAVLLQLPDHMAVGVACPEPPAGTCYEFEGSRYCYLETTGRGWTIGEVPPDFQAGSRTAIVHPMVRAPRIDLQFTAELERTDLRFAYYRVRCEIENLGPGAAAGPKVHLAALALAQGEGMVWPPDCTLDLGDYPEGARGRAEATLKIPRGETARIRCVVYGDNFQPAEALSDPFTA